MPPYLLLSVLLGAIYGTLFHLWRGSKVRDLLIYVAAGILGFLLGQVLGSIIDLNFFTIGQLYPLEGTLLSWAGLLLIHWLKI